MEKVLFFVFSGLVGRYYCTSGGGRALCFLAHSLLLHLWGMKGLDSEYGRNCVHVRGGGGGDHFFTSSGVCEGD